MGVLEMNVSKIDQKTLKNAKQMINRVLQATLKNPNNPDSLNFFQSDTYRFYFLMSFMSEFLENNEISQEYAISLVPQKFASRIKRLQVLKQAVQLGFIIEESSTVDKRRRIYYPSEILLNDFFEYAANSNSIILKDNKSL
tara:strand:- start:775 stop:1197 length:423 start_codon:yes stop_codon:yes gene_type:complete